MREGIIYPRPVPDAIRPATPDEELLGAERPAVATERTEEERLERIREELVAGYEALGGLGCAVSIFGSARTPRDHPDYALARETARRLGEAGFAVITGGGPGIMEAANRGAKESGVTSVGLNIDLPFEQGANAYQDIALRFHYFFTRKLMFVRFASAFVVFPGGFGTLDELFEALVLIQTGKIRHFPVDPRPAVVLGRHDRLDARAAGGRRDDRAVRPRPLHRHRRPRRGRRARARGRATTGVQLAA